MIVNATPHSLAGRFFRFFRREPNVPGTRIMSDRMTFFFDGTIKGFQHPKEKRWQLLDDRLEILSENGSVSYALMISLHSDKRYILRGSFQTPQGTVDNWFEELPSRSNFISQIPHTLRFIGEFGEEINHFIPMIHWLYQNGEMANRFICSYRGMEPFYFFLPPEKFIPQDEPRKFVVPSEAPAYFLHPSGLDGRRTGMEWAPDFRSRYKTDFGFSKPIFVIHNKYSSEWGPKPVNFFSLDLLAYLFHILKDDFQVVFFEAARASDKKRGYSADHQGLLEYNDYEVAQKNKEVICFSDLLKARTESYNELKLKVFSSCYHFLTVQGGNAHLCAMFNGSLVGIQHIRGREEFFCYKSGIFRHSTNPSPMYMVGRTDDEIKSIALAMRDSKFLEDRVCIADASVATFKTFSVDATCV